MPYYGEDKPGKQLATLLKPHRRQACRCQAVCNKTQLTTIGSLKEGTGALKRMGTNDDTHCNSTCSTCNQIHALATHGYWLRTQAQDVPGADCKLHVTRHTNSAYAHLEARQWPEAPCSC